MALYQRAPYETVSRQDAVEDESDREEEALVEDYKEQVHFDEGMSELDRTASFGGAGGGGGPQDMQAQLAAAATPLEYGAALDTKFASYDNYCNLFHYILNSEGPVDLEVPTVSFAPSASKSTRCLMGILVLLGMGRNRRVHLSIRILLPVSQPHRPNRIHQRRGPTPAR